MKVALAATVALILSACATSGPPASQASDDLRAANAAYDAALISADRQALEEILTDDFRFVTDTGAIVDKRTQIDDLTSGRFDILTAASDELSIERHGDAALIVGRFRASVRYGDEQTDIVERYTTLWVWRDGRWRLRHEHSSLQPRP